MSVDTDACQYAVDEIHRLTHLLSAVMHKTDKAITKKGAVAAMKELQALGASLFQGSGQTVQELLDEEFPYLDKMIASMCAKEGIDPSADVRLTEQHSQSDAALSRLLEEMKGRHYANGLAMEEALLFVRDMEAKYAFQQGLWHEKQEIVNDTHCSLDNLTYGSSSLTLWADLMSQEPVQRALAPGSERQVVIFGSSQGLLALYTHALAVHHGLHTPPASSTVDLFNTSKVTGLPTNRPAARTAGTHVVRVAGYEILPTLWAVSNYLGNKHFRGQHGDHISFRLQDMLTADVSSADLLVLTSLCWDAATRRAVAQKLTREMKVGAVVVDYRAETFSQFGLEAGGGVYSSSSVKDAAAPAAAAEEKEKEKEGKLRAAVRAKVLAHDLRALQAALTRYIVWQTRGGKGKGKGRGAGGEAAVNTHKAAAAQRAFETCVFSAGGRAQGPARCYPPPAAGEEIRYLPAALRSLQPGQGQGQGQGRGHMEGRRTYSRAALVALRPPPHAGTGTGTGTAAAPVEGQGRFELRSIIEGSCSWASRQPLYLFIKQEED